MFKTSQQSDFMLKSEGTWGEFKTPGGPVRYLLTNARLGSTGPDYERRLTNELRPVREVMNADELEFAQLLQRDLDDHRVSTKLIPYLLQSGHGPAFFPPILAAILPFEGRTPIEELPSPTKIEPHEDATFSAHVAGTQYGNAFAHVHLAQPGGEVHPIRLGRLLWNPERAKVVVLDGQHRAMALIAINRTLNDTWDESSGQRYRHFYEQRVKDLLIDNEFDPSTVAFPVAVCWFPEAAERRESPHRYARKLFVDVNREARAPSESRLILLSETDLENVLTRRLLDAVRKSSTDMPLIAVEYDSPHNVQARPEKWSVVTNLLLIRRAVRHLVFGPPYVLQQYNTLWRRGPLPRREMDLLMREQLDVGGLFDDEFDDGDRRIVTAEIGNENFPRAHLEPLVARFLESYGSAMLTLMSDILIFRPHYAALEELRVGWTVDELVDSLAHEALFQGVGMYWTLESIHADWETRSEEDKPDVVRAWEVVEDRRDAFEKRRAEILLEMTMPEERPGLRAACDELYGVARTFAFQLGLVLAFGSLARESQLQHKDIASAAVHFVETVNEAMRSRTDKGVARVFWCLRRPPGEVALNRLGPLNTPDAVYFRFFWIALFASAWNGVDAFTIPGVRRALRESRSVYARELERIERRALKGADAVRWEENQTAVEAEARAKAEQLLRLGLEAWFGGDPADRLGAADGELTADDLDEDEEEEFVGLDEGGGVDGLA